MAVGKIDPNLVSGQVQKKNDIWSVENKGVFQGGEQKTTFEKVLQDAKNSQAVEGQSPEVQAKVNQSQQDSQVTPRNNDFHGQAVETQAAVDGKKGIWSVNNRGVFMGGEQKITFERLSAQDQSQGSAKTATNILKTDAVTAATTQGTAAQAPQSNNTVNVTSSNDQELKNISSGNKGVFVNGEQRMSSQALVSEAAPSQTNAATIEKPEMSSATQAPVVVEGSKTEALQTKPEAWSVNNRGIFVNGEQRIPAQAIATENANPSQDTQSTAKTSNAASTQSPKAIIEKPASEAAIREEVSIVTENKPNVGMANNRGVFVNGEQRMSSQPSVQEAASIQTNAAVIEKPKSAFVSQPLMLNNPAQPPVVETRTDIWSVGNNGLFVNGQQKLTYEQLQALKTASSLTNEVPSQVNTPAQTTEVTHNDPVVFSQTYQQNSQKEEKNVFQKILDFFNVK